MKIPTAPILLSITGSDGSGGAGIQADIRAISHLGGRALTVVTAVTVQNSHGIQGIYELPAEVIAQQIDAVAEDSLPPVVKIGMLRSRSAVELVAERLRKYRPRWVLYCPVVWSSVGECLLDDGLLDVVRRVLLPLCTAVVLRRRDADCLGATEGVHTVLVESDLHGRCNEFCSALGVYLLQTGNLLEAVEKVRYILPSTDPEERAPQITSLRCRELYAKFVASQRELCNSAHDVNFYAAQLGVTPRYLAQVTRRVANVTPKSVIDATMIERIKACLLGSQPLQEIAMSLGFSSQAHFTHYFKKLTGLTPTDYRRSAVRPEY